MEGKVVRICYHYFYYSFINAEMWKSEILYEKGILLNTLYDNHAWNVVISITF